MARNATGLAMFRLDGKRAFVTGAATGLGQAIAVALADSGADVVVSDLETGALDETAARLEPTGRRVVKLAVDVRDPAQIKAGVAEAEDRFGGIDILVNNAGINRPTPGLQVTVDLWNDHFDTNVRGGFLMAQAVAPGMIERRHGRIIFIASQSGLIAVPGQPVYCASKGAVIQLARALGIDWAAYGITVNSIAPTFIETRMTARRLQDPEFRKFVLGKIPCGRLAKPENIAAAAVYLASDEAALVNAETHSVDGGWTAW